MPTVSPPPRSPGPTPSHHDDSHADGWVELIKWILTDHRRAAWAFAALTAVLITAAFAAAVLAPHLGDLGGVLGGSAVGGGLGLGGGVAVNRYRRRHHDVTDDESRISPHETSQDHEPKTSRTTRTSRSKDEGDEVSS